MIQDRRWKMAVNREGATYLLLDLESDPRETQNLAGSPDHGGVVAGLRSRLLERLVASQLIRAGEPRRTAPSRSLMTRLRSALSGGERRESAVREPD
jgi:hypothetical protein